MEVAIEQLEQLVPVLPQGVRVLADHWYVTGPFVLACQRLQLDTLMRLKRNRKLYRPAPPPVAGKRGAPRKDGALFQGSRPQTWGEPEACWVGEDERGKAIQVQSWQGLHFLQARQVEVAVYRILRAGARESKRDPRESWFVWIAPAPLAPWEVAGTYRRRFAHEHTYRFLKQDLFWTKVRVRTPAQFECWSMVVATAMNQLVLARQLGQALYRPWEQRRQVVTPRQVGRVMPAILLQVGTPAQRFCQNSNLNLAQKSEFWYADLNYVIERGTLINELSLLHRNDDPETNEENQTGVYYLLLSEVSTYLQRTHWYPFQLS